MIEMHKLLLLNVLFLPWLHYKVLMSCCMLFLQGFKATLKAGVQNVFDKLKTFRQHENPSTSEYEKS